MIKSKIEVFEGVGGGFFWRCRHRNGQIVATGNQSYATKSNARRAARRIAGTMLLAPVVEVQPSTRPGDYRAR